MKKIFCLLSTIALTTTVIISVTACDFKDEIFNYDKTFNHDVPYKSFYNKNINGYQFNLYEDTSSTINFPTIEIIIFDEEYNKFEDKLEKFVKKTDSDAEGIINKLKFNYYTKTFKSKYEQNVDLPVLKQLYDIKGTRT